MISPLISTPNKPLAFPNPWVTLIVRQDECNWGCTLSLTASTCAHGFLHDRNVTFIACLLHRKVRVCVCVEEREGKDGGEGIMVASVDRRGEAKCLQTHRPYMSPDSPHVACVPAGRQATPHATTLQPIKRPAQHGFPLATGAWLNLHGHQLPHWSNQNCSHMLLTVGGCGCDLIKIWTQEDSPSQTHAHPFANYI